MDKERGTQEGIETNCKKKEIDTRRRLFDREIRNDREIEKKKKEREK